LLECPSFVRTEDARLIVSIRRCLFLFVHSRPDFRARRYTFGRAIDLLGYREHHNNLTHQLYSSLLTRHLPWWTARLQPSQKTIALEFSPSPSSHIEHLESSTGR
jgi:hypothetical protein